MLIGFSAVSSSDLVRAWATYGEANTMVGLGGGEWRERGGRVGW